MSESMLNLFYEEEVDEYIYECRIRVNYHVNKAQKVF